MRAGHARRKRALAQKGAAKVAGKVAPEKASAARPAPAARKIVKRPAPRKAAPPRSAARKSAWASMLPEQRAERIARMRSGRKGGAVSAPAAT